MPVVSRTVLVYRALWHSKRLPSACIDPASVEPGICAESARHVMPDPTHFCLTRVHREPGAQPVRQRRPLRAAACTTLTRHALRWRGPTARVIPRLRHRPRAPYWRPLAKGSPAGAGWLQSLLRIAAARPQPHTPAVALVAHPSPTAYRLPPYTSTNRPWPPRNTSRL